jgi:hypothetical protein
VWQSAQGSTLQVNACKRNRKEVDLACVRCLAKLQDSSFGELRDKMYTFLRRGSGLP